MPRKKKVVETVETEEQEREEVQPQADEPDNGEDRAQKAIDVVLRGVFWPPGDDWLGRK